MWDRIGFMGMEFEYVGLRHQWCLVVTGLLLLLWVKTYGDTLNGLSMSHVECYFEIRFLRCFCLISMVSSHQAGSGGES